MVKQLSLALMYSPLAPAATWDEWQQKRAERLSLGLGLKRRRRRRASTSRRRKNGRGPSR